MATQPPAPPQVTQAAAQIDSMNQSIYVSMAKDPVLGPLVKAIPPPPKVSAIFNGTFLNELTRGLPAGARQVASQYPILVPSQASERPTSPPGQNQTSIVV